MINSCMIERAEMKSEGIQNVLLNEPSERRLDN
jgi:hypothetical protein